MVDPRIPYQRGSVAPADRKAKLDAKRQEATDNTDSKQSHWLDSFGLGSCLSDQENVDKPNGV